MLHALRPLGAARLTSAHLPLQASEIRDEVIIAAKASIAEKGSFSLCIPGGSVVAAVKELEADAFDFSKTHIFLANEKIPSYVCIDGAIDAFESKGVPKDQARHPREPASLPEPPERARVAADLRLRQVGLAGRCGGQVLGDAQDEPEHRQLGRAALV